MELLDFNTFLTERNNADSMRNKWLDPANGNDTDETTIMFPSIKGLELDVEFEKQHNKTVITSAIDTTEKIDWCDYFDKSALELMADIVDEGNDSKFTPFKDKDLEMAEVKFPNNSGIKLFVYYQYDKNDELDIDSARVGKKDDDISEFFNDKAIDLIYKLLEKELD